MTDIVVPLDPPDDGGVTPPPPLATGCALVDLRQGVRSVARDSLGIAITDADIDGWLNEAQRDIAIRTGNLQKETTGTFDAAGTTSLPGDFVSMHWLKVNGASDEVQFVDDAVFMSWLDQAQSVGGSSIVLGRIFAEAIETYPVQDSVDYVLRYQYDPPEMVADADHSALPRFYCPKMINYARAHAMYKDGDTGMGDRYMSMYESGLPGSEYGRARLNPGPMTMRFQRGPFDTLDARHW